MSHNGEDINSVDFLRNNAPIFIHKRNELLNDQSNEVNKPKAK